jgi:hypothetical protein
MVSSQEEFQNEVQSIFLLPVVHLECPLVAGNDGPRLQRMGLKSHLHMGDVKKGNAATDLGTSTLDKVRNHFI